MNKVLKVFFAFLVVSVFVSCSKKEQSKEIEFITNRTDLVNGTPDANGKKDPKTAAFKHLADKFKKETGITVKLTAYTDFKNSLRRRLSSGDYGDVITNDDFSTKTLQQFFQPLGVKKDYSNYRFVDYSSVGDQVYGLASGYYLVGAVYNKNVLAKAGYKTFPETISELNNAMSKIKANGEIPIIINRGTNWPLYFIDFMANDFDGKAGTKNRLWQYNNPFSEKHSFGKAIALAAKWVHNKWTEPEFIAIWEESKTQIATGKAGMMLLGSWIVPQVITRAESIKGCDPNAIAFAPIPKLDSQKKHYIYASPEKALLISKKTKNFEAAKKWIMYIINSGIYQKQGALPIEKGKTEALKQLQPTLKEIASGKLTVLEAVAPSKYQGNRTSEILKDMDIYSDSKYLGRPLDAANKSMKDFDECIKQMNIRFAEIKKAKGYTNK